MNFKPMITYIVHIDLDNEIKNEYLKWLMDIHIPEVLSTGLFSDSCIYNEIELPDTKDSNKLAVHYKLESWEKFNIYQRDFAPGLRQKATDKFGDKFKATRSFLEEI